MPDPAFFVRRTHGWRLLALAATLLTAGAAGLRAQCPDGTPPPCGGARPAAPRRVNPPIDERAWIVLPFDNTTRAADIDWLRDASVDLLYLDLSKWNDIRVVDSKRVADFMREVPASAGANKLSLNDALAVARRAGAGNLVMGDVLKLGTRTSVTATVFDVKKGDRLRSVREEATSQDSLLPLFSRLARGILRVAPPSGTSLGTVGTSRIDAYQEYLAGVQALNRFDVVEAKRRLERAIALDTAFALAHYKWAIASTYDDAAANARIAKLDLDKINNVVVVLSEDSSRALHAAIAARLSGPLPARDRAMINGLLAQTRHDYKRACEAFSTLVHADSSDVEALYGLGQCLYHDDVVEAIGGDTTRLRFRSSWNSALAVFRRIIAVDPTFHLAFNDLLSILSSSARVGCRRDDLGPACPTEPGATVSAGMVRRNGDSLVIAVRQISAAEAMMAMATQTDRSGTRRRNLEEARAAAEEWVAAGPTERRAHRALARLHLQLGQLTEAQAQLAEAGREADDPELARMRLELALKFYRGAEVTHLLDSLLVVWTDPVPHTSISLFTPVIGRTTELDTTIRSLFRRATTPSPPAVVEYLVQSVRFIMGTAGDSAVASERRLMGLLQANGACGASCASFMSPSWTFGLRAPRSPRPVFDSTAKGLRVAPAAALSRGDTAALRVAAVALDSVSRSMVRAGTAEDGTGILASDAFLALGDTTAALRILVRVTDTTLLVTPMEAPIGIGMTFAAMVWPRTMLERADLEAALGHRSEARIWYQRFLSFWSHPDPEFAPLAERARKALGALGPP